MSLSRGVITSRTHLDRLAKVLDLVDKANRITYPVLLVQGDQEPIENYSAGAFQENCVGPCEVAIIPNCDHFYVGAEDLEAKTLTDWLEKKTR